MRVERPAADGAYARYTRMKMRSVKFLAVVLLSLAVSSCGGNSAPPTSPSPGGTTAPPVTANVAPGLDAPGADEQLATIRPTLRVRNGTSSQTGAKTYEFQVSDRSDFGSGSATSSYYAVSFGRAGVGEGGSTTSVEVDQDLQPATRFYWRARWVQGSTNGDWSSTFTFRTQVVGYNRPGELYDPLVNGASVAEALTAGRRSSRGKGLRLPDTNAYARYRLAQPIWTGEFSR